MTEEAEQANANEGGDPAKDVRAQNPGETTASDTGKKPATDDIDEDDPHKVEKLATLGHAGDEAAEGTE